MDKTILFSRGFQEFLQTPLALAIGTASAAKIPDCTAASALAFADDRARFTVFATKAHATHMIRNLKETERLALTACRLSDFRTYQFKGRALAVRDATRAEAERICKHMSEFGDWADMEGLGHLARNFLIAPALAVDVVLEEFFLQTPGPGTGRRL